jgi:hypothetical protein
MRAEVLHLNAVWRPNQDPTRDDGELLEELLEQGAASIGGAMTGAVARYVREHPHDEDPDLQRLATEAERVVACLPTRLHRLWELHYVEGHPLAVYAAATGLDAAAAEADYCEIIPALARISAARTKEELPASGVQCAHAPCAVSPTGAA